MLTALFNAPVTFGVDLFIWKENAVMIIYGNTEGDYRTFCVYIPSLAPGGQGRDINFF